jgi:hypothetical protein
MSENKEQTVQTIQAGVAWSEIQLKEKLVDPSIVNKKELNRNLQLGFIDKQLFKDLSRKTYRANIFLTYDDEISQEYGISNLKNNEEQLVMSGSIGGKVRDSLNTTNQNQRYYEERSGMFSGLFKRKQQ